MNMPTMTYLTTQAITFHYSSNVPNAFAHFEMIRLTVNYGSNFLHLYTKNKRMIGNVYQFSGKFQTKSKLCTISMQLVFSCDKNCCYSIIVTNFCLTFRISFRLLSLLVWIKMCECACDKKQKNLALALDQKIKNNSKFKRFHLNTEMIEIKAFVKTLVKWKIIINVFKNQNESMWLNSYLCQMLSDGCIKCIMHHYLRLMMFT